MACTLILQKLKRKVLELNVFQVRKKTISSTYLIKKETPDHRERKLYIQVYSVGYVNILWCTQPTTLLINWWSSVVYIWRKIFLFVSFLYEENPLYLYNPWDSTGYCTQTMLRGELVDKILKLQSNHYDYSWNPPVKTSSIIII